MDVRQIKIVRRESDNIPLGMGNRGFAQYSCPVTLEGSRLKCELKSDPLITVSRPNEIKCRSVAKPVSAGTIKESWAVGDWEVTIAGVIIADTEDELLEHVQLLSEICKLRESLEVTCLPLFNLGIFSLAVKQLQLPFTPGLLNQQFTITALSDTSHELLEEL